MKCGLLISALSIDPYRAGLWVIFDTIMHQSNIILSEKMRHSIASSDGISRAEESFQAAVLPEYVDGTCIMASHTLVSWLFPLQFFAPSIPKHASEKNSCG